MQPARYWPIEPAEILITHELQRVGDPLEGNGRVRLELADVIEVGGMQPEAGQPAAAAPRQCVVRLCQARIQLSIEPPQLEQLHVGELQNEPGFFRIGVEQEARSSGRTSARAPPARPIGVRTAPTMKGAGMWER